MVRPSDATATIRPTGPETTALPRLAGRRGDTSVVRPGYRARVFEDRAPKGEEELGCPRRGGARRWAIARRRRRRSPGGSRVAGAPPQRDGRTHLGKLEAPGAPQVGELVREPEAAVAERLDSAARVRLVGEGVARRRRRLPPPLLERPRRHPRRCPGDSHDKPYLAGQVPHQIRRRHRADQRHSRDTVRSDRRQRERVRSTGRPADDSESLDRKRVGRRLAPRPQRLSRRDGPQRSTAISRTPSAAAIASSGCRESRESPPPCR